MKRRLGFILNIFFLPRTFAKGKDALLNSYPEKLFSHVLRGYLLANLFSEDREAEAD